MPFLTELDMRSARGKRGVILLQEFRYFSERYKKEIIVPKGEYTNFGSVPSIIPPILVPRVGKYKEAYVIHDHLYVTKGDNLFTRYQSDMILYDAIKELGGVALRRMFVLMGVRSNILAEYLWDRKEEEKKEK